MKLRVKNAEVRRKDSKREAQSLVVCKITQRTTSSRWPYVTKTNMSVTSKQKYY